LLGVEAGVANLRSEKQEGARLIRAHGIDGDLRIRFWPDDVPGEPAFFERPDNVAREVKLPPFQPVRRTARFGVVIIVVALAKGAEPDPEIILAVVGRLETAITERRQVKL
jgi:hypothetical protein